MNPQSPQASAPVDHLALHKGQVSYFGVSDDFEAAAKIGSLKTFLHPGHRTAFPEYSGLVSRIFLQAGQAHLNVVISYFPDLQDQG